MLCSIRALLLFWITFQEGLNRFSTPDLLSHPPFHLYFGG